MAKKASSSGATGRVTQVTGAVVDVAEQDRVADADAEHLRHFGVRLRLIERPQLRSFERHGIWWTCC